MLDAPIGNEPENRDEDVDRLGRPGRKKTAKYPGRIQERREFSLPVTSNRLAEDRVWPLRSDDGVLQDEIGNASHQQDETVKGSGRKPKVILAHPTRGKREKGQPEQQVQIRPQNRPGDASRGMQHMVVIVPVDPYIQEAQHVAEENRKQRAQHRNAFALRHLHFQHHDGDDDRDYAVAESFQAPFAHDGHTTGAKAWNSLADLATCLGTAASSRSRIAMGVCWLSARTRSLLPIWENVPSVPEFPEFPRSPYC